jgi:hypothetical protein
MFRSSDSSIPFEKSFAERIRKSLAKQNEFIKIKPKL